MAIRHIDPLVETIRAHAEPLTGAPQAYDRLLTRIGDSRFVLIGEASHGTHEFYKERAEITKRLIEEKGFTAVAVEADWPDAYRINRFVKGIGEDETAVEALGDFERFPTWMWRNSVVLDFIGWLREHNDSLPAGAPKVGFYGIDLYSLYASLEAVIGYLEKVDPEAAQRARRRYACFESFEKDVQAYGYAAALGGGEPCEDEVVAQLGELRQHAFEYARRDGRLAEDEYFFAEQNARLAKNAEQYYRSMFRGRVSSWNLRDRHMTETLAALEEHIGRQLAGLPGQVQRPRFAVWAHNSHLGDARATEMGQGGELNVGQLVRERWGDESFLIGFSTYHGTVTAASDWDMPAARKRVRPGLPDSYEAILHEVCATAGLMRFMLDLRGRAAEPLRQPRLQRAIGVIYRPETERQSHYFQARLADQFDAVLHFDETRAVEPLERTPGWIRGEHEGEAPETYPWAV
jgi:erythromycin esterase-like protein